MILAINAAQSKTVSISFTFLKGSIFAFISHYNTISMTNTKCSPTIESYFQLMKAVIPLCILVDLCFLVYFYMSFQFNKMLYYVYYVFHWIITLISLMGSSYNLVYNPQCQQSYSFAVSILSNCILYQLNTIIAMIQDLNFVLRYLHFGSNLVWFVLWYSTQVNKCTQPLQTLIAYIHAGLSLVNFANLLFTKLLGRSHSLSRSKFIIAISLLMMLCCYLLIIIQGYIPEACNSSRLFQKNYMGYGLIELISPLLLLIFLEQEVDDPHQIFGRKDLKCAQNEYNQPADFFVQN